MTKGLRKPGVSGLLAKVFRPGVFGDNASGGSSGNSHSLRSALQQIEEAYLQGSMPTLLTILLMLRPISSALANFIGPVVSVLDGDTIEVLHNTHPERVRLSDIDCPEKGQAYGKRAKQAASAFVFGKEVTLQTYGKDKYGRTLTDAALGSMDGTQAQNWRYLHGRRAPWIPDQTYSLSCPR